MCLEKYDINRNRHRALWELTDGISDISFFIQGKYKRQK
jgi:hypothetical protein